MNSGGQPGRGEGWVMSWKQSRKETPHLFSFLGIFGAFFGGFFLQIAFVFTQVGERDKSSVGCGKKIVLGGMKGSL